MDIVDRNMTGKLSLEQYMKSKLEFNLARDRGFTHNFNRDLQFVIIWENGRVKEEAILNEIKKKFNILYCAEIIWSEENKMANFNRIYCQDKNSKAYLKKLNHVGDGPFLIIVLEDENPNYGYSRSLDGTISISNLNVIELKYWIRNLLNDNFAHGSSGIDEFFHHASLIFHEDILRKIITLENWDGKIHKIEQDLAGAEGWSNFDEFFKIANYCTDYLILRNHEFLPYNFWGNDKDIDILCEDLDIFTSVANATKRSRGISAFETLIEGKLVPMDIRYVGDNYYDPVWEKNMLENKIYSGGIVPRLSDDDYFFSLFYHSRLQKQIIKEDYKPLLFNLARRLRIEFFNEDIINNDKSSALFLDGFLKEKGYYYFQPLDKSVYINHSVRKYMKRVKIYSRKTSFRKILIDMIFILYRLIPSPLKKLIPEKFKLTFRYLR